MRRGVRIAFVAMTAIAVACGSYGGEDEPAIPPPPPPTTAPTLDGSITPTADGSVPSIPEPSSDGPCDPNEVPSADGIFVSLARGSDENAGSAVSPVSSIVRALSLATGDAHREIYIAQGDYSSPDKLNITTPDLRITGGWREDPLRWTRDCSPGRRTKTVIYVGVSPAMGDSFTESGVGKIVLEGLSIATVSNTSGNDSAYTLLLKGEGPEWNLSDVTLVADVGRDGEITAGTPGAPGTCVCSAADATNGKVGTDGTPVAPRFTGNGFVRGSGTAGSAGGAGTGGKAPAAPPSASDAFAGGCGDFTEPNCGSKTPLKTVTSGAGKCGCGGNGGRGGGGGGGGGASIALFVAGSRHVRASYMHMKTSRGGNGAKGGPGEPGSPGTAGAPGTALTYNADRCVGQAGGGTNQPCKGENRPPKSLPAGPAGGNGGAGAAGGAGGPGAGGASIGLVRGRATIVELGDGIIYEIGAPGEGAEGAVAGPTGERLDLP